MYWKVQLKLFSLCKHVSLCFLGSLLGGLTILGVDHCFTSSFVLEQVDLYLFCQQGISLWENFRRMYYCMPFPHMGNFDASMCGLQGIIVRTK